jgi:bifunctional NMN adenylyltransferase/nudix hydrolase
MEHKTVGVLIGRFQSPYLHSGHNLLIDKIFSKHSKVIILIGVAKIQNTKRNPLDFITRKVMIQKIYPNAVILPIEDNRCDEKWSKNVDSLIRSVFPETNAILYGSRDSFIPNYCGKHTTEYVETTSTANATDIRAVSAETVLDIATFRSGVIYGISKQRPVTYPTVDIAVSDGEGNILLARKPSEDKFRFVGGFVDRGDNCYETAARRELYEETQLSALSMTYICSDQIKDWRYDKEESGIMTTLFLTHVWDQMGKPIASDDIQEVKWFNASLFLDVNNINSLIVPEHQNLMTLFMSEVIKGGLIRFKKETNEK